MPDRTNKRQEKHEVPFMTHRGRQWDHESEPTDAEALLAALRAKHGPIEGRKEFMRLMKNKG